MAICEGKVDSIFRRGDGFLVELILDKEHKPKQKLLFPTSILKKELGGDYPIQRGDNLSIVYSGKENRVESYSLI